MHIDTFGILGAGTLGWRIGLQAAISGYDVLMLDLSDEVLTRAQHFQAELLGKLVKRGRVPVEELSPVLARVRVTTSREEFATSVDFVSESVTEDLELKRRVWEGFAGRWRSGTLLTTNTSYLLPSQMAEASGDPSNFCAFHFHDVFEARVVDVMPHPGTHERHVARLMALGRELNQIPVHVRQETPGYLFNHMLMAYLGAAGQLLAAGKATPLEIDRSWMGNMGTSVGPFGMMDQIGLDTVQHVVGARTDHKSRAFAGVIAPLVEAGKLGVKTGAGFYDYPQPDYRAEDFLA